jgi:hypothetical protein
LFDIHHSTLTLIEIHSFSHHSMPMVKLMEEGEGNVSPELTSSSTVVTAQGKEKEKAASSGAAVRQMPSTMLGSPARERGFVIRKASLGWEPNMSDIL